MVPLFITTHACAHIWRTQCMQYAVFVYISSAQAVIQDLFLFLFKTKTVSGANRTSRERNEHLIMGERKISKKNYSRNEQWYSIVARWAVGLTMITQVKGPE